MPAVPDQKLVGTLTIQKDGRPDLELASQTGNEPQGSLAALLHPRDQFNGDNENLMVHGQSLSGELFTLYDGRVPDFELGMAPMTMATLSFNRGFKGACIDDPSTLEVTRVYMRYPGMDAWLAAQPFEVQQDWKAKRVTISHTIPEEESFGIDDERRLILAWTRNGPSQSLVQTRIDMKVLPWLGIEYASPVTPDKASDDAYNVAQLLSMLLGSPTTTRDVSMMSPQHTLEVGGKEDLRELHVLAGRFRLPESFRKWTTHDVLLPLSVMRPQFESVLQRWFRVRHECWGVIVPYLASQRSPAPLAERRFFDFAATAESLHAHFRPNDKNFADKEAQAIWKKVRLCVPKERRTAFSSALRRVNELTYKERLERLLYRFPAITKDVIGDSNEQAIFCKIVKDLRNVGAHRLRRTDETNVGGSKLVRIAAKLKAILDAWILAEIGIDENVIHEQMQKTRRYWFYASRETWPWNIPSSD